MTRCKECRYGANQHSAWFTFCEKHYRLFMMACATKGITLEQLMDDAIEKYIHNHHPDFRRWIA